MKPEKATNIIRYLSLGLIFLLAVGAFVLSYNALLEVAKSNGVPPELAWLWPLLVDGAIIVFSLAVVRNGLLGEKTGWPWTLVIVATVGTIVLNGLHSSGEPLAIAVAVVAPIALVLAFETSMAMLKSDVKRSGLVQSIEQLAAKLSELEGLYRVREDNLEAELKRLQHDRLAEIETKAQARQTELDALIVTRQNELDKAGRDLETIQAQIAQAQTELTDILGQVEGQKAGQKDKDIPIVIIGEGLDLPKMKPAERQKYLPQLINGGVDKDRILDIFGISAKTLDRDIKECNGAIMDPADIPFMAGGRNGHNRKVG